VYYCRPRIGYLDYCSPRKRQTVAIGSLPAGRRRRNSGGGNGGNGKFPHFVYSLHESQYVMAWN